MQQCTDINGETKKNNFKMPVVNINEFIQNRQASMLSQ